MTAAIVLDFPRMTKEQYEQVVERMALGGRMAPGGLLHVAGAYRGGWRVIDVWEDLETFERFRDEQIGPHTQALGIVDPPAVRVVEVSEDKGGNGRRPALVQCVILPGLDRAAFAAVDGEVTRDGMPGEITFHVNGPLDDGWCVVDGWTSQQARDQLARRIQSAVAGAPLGGPMRMEDLIVQATLAGHATARV